MPDRLKGSEHDKGYVLSADERKFWLRAYATNMISENAYQFSVDMGLQVPALHDFMKWTSR